MSAIANSAAATPPSSKAAKRPEQPPPDTPCRAYEIGHTRCDGHVLGEGQRRLESVAALNCCASCCENAFPANARYVISTSPKNPNDANAKFVADALVKKLAKGCARQGGVWRTLDREGFGNGKGYQLLYPHGGRPPAVALVTECLPEMILLEPRTWKERTLTSLLAPIDALYLVDEEDAPTSTAEQGSDESTAAAVLATALGGSAAILEAEGDEKPIEQYTRLYTAQQTFCILKKNERPPGLPLAPLTPAAAVPRGTPARAAGHRSAREEVTNRFSSVRAAPRFSREPSHASSPAHDPPEVLQTAPYAPRLRVDGHADRDDASASDEEAGGSE